jgi:uncharacterized membrane protein
MDKSPPPSSAPPSPAGIGSTPARDAPRQRPGSVPSAHGATWWGDGWRLFTASPGTWIAITVLFVILMLMLALIPILGTVATTALSPVFAGGVLSGCRKLDRGGALTIGDLFTSFSDRPGPLVAVGLLYLAGSLVIVVAVVACVVGAVGMAGMSALLSGDPMRAGMAIFATLGIGAALAALVAMLLGIPLLMAYWFAAALVVLRNDEPVAAMKASFDACLVNMLPMLVYSLLGIVFAIVATIPLGLGWLVLGPVFAATIYTSYKDIFETPH